MPRKAKSDDTEGKVLEAKPGRNGYDPDQVQSFVDRYENLQADIDKIMADAREQCQPVRDDMKELIAEAAEAGLPKKPFRAIIAKRRLLKKAEKANSALSDEQKETFEQIEHALGMLGDLPLGAAALDKARPKNGGDAAARA